MDITKNTLAEKLNLIASKVYVGIHYTINEDATRMYGLVTTNKSIIEGPNRPWDWPEDRAKKERKYVFWDAVLGTWLVLDYDRVKQQRYDKLDTLESVHKKQGWPLPDCPPSFLPRSHLSNLTFRNCYWPWWRGRGCHWGILSPTRPLGRRAPSVTCHPCHGRVPAGLRNRPHRPSTRGFAGFRPTLARR